MSNPSAGVESLINDDVHDGTLERVALTVTRHEIGFLADVGLIRPWVEHEIVVAFLCVKDDPMGLQVGCG